MMLIFPPEREKQWEKIKQYMDGCHLRDDAPEEIKEIADDYHEWLNKEMEHRHG